MPQMQLPIFPAGVTEINSRVAVEAKDGQVCYVYGHLPVFQHEETDVRSFRMFTSQMIVTGSVKPKTNRRDVRRTDGHCQAIHESVSAAGCEGILREQAAAQFSIETESRNVGKCTAVLDEGRSVPEVAEEIDVLANTIHKAIRAGRLGRPPSEKKANPRQ